MNLNKPLRPKTEALETVLRAAIDRDCELVGHPMPTSETAVKEAGDVLALIEAFRQAKMVRAAHGSPDWLAAQMNLSDAIKRVCDENEEGDTPPELYWRVAHRGSDVR